MLHEDDVALDPVSVAEAPELDDDVEAREAPPRWRWQRIAAIVVLVGLAAFLVFQLFTGPIERLWYHSRQSQLSSDLTTPHRHIAPGQAVAVLQIPRLGTNVVIGQGDSPERLRSGPGHRMGTAMPGQRGNSVVVGHRTAWGGPFGALTKVKRNDYVVVQNKTLKTYVYRVRSIRKVGGGETELLRSSKDHRLTLVTGRGGRSSDDRLIVTAISGRPAPASATVRQIRAETPGPSLVFNMTLLIAIVAFALMYAAWCVLRRKSGLAARIVVMAPLGAVGLLASLLYLDLYLSPLH